MGSKHEPISVPDNLIRYKLMIEEINGYFSQRIIFISTDAQECIMQVLGQIYDRYKDYEVFVSSSQVKLRYGIKTHELVYARRKEKLKSVGKYKDEHYYKINDVVEWLKNRKEKKQKVSDSILVLWPGEAR